MGNTLLTAARDGNIEKLESLLEDPKTNINFQDDEHGVTALMEAASQGHMDVVSFLIDRKANVNIMSKHGVPAIIYAATKNHFEIVDFLAYHGASAKQLNHINKSISYDRAGVEKAYAAGAARRAAAGLPPVEVFIPQKRASVEENEVPPASAIGEGEAGRIPDTPRPPSLGPNNALSSSSTSLEHPTTAPPSASSASTTTTTSTAASSSSSSVFGELINKAKNVLAPKNTETSGAHAQPANAANSSHPDYNEFSSATAVLRGEVEKLKAFLASGGGSQEELEEKERELLQERARIKQLQQENQRLEAQVHQLMALKQRGESVVDETPPEWLEEKIQLLTKNKELTLLVEELKSDLAKARREAKSWKAVMDSYVNAGEDDVMQSDQVEQDQEQFPEINEQTLDKEKAQTVAESVTEIPKANEPHEAEMKQEQPKEEDGTSQARRDSLNPSESLSESNDATSSESKLELEQTVGEVPASTQTTAEPRETESPEAVHVTSEGRRSQDHSEISRSSEVLLEGESTKASDQPFGEISESDSETQEIPSATNTRLDIDWLNGVSDPKPTHEADADADQQASQEIPTTNTRLDIDWLNGVASSNSAHEGTQADEYQQATQEIPSATNTRLDIDWLNGVAGPKPTHEEAEADADEQVTQETPSARLDIDWLNGVASSNSTREAEVEDQQVSQEIPSVTNARLDIDWLNGVGSQPAHEAEADADQATPAVLFHTMDNATQDSNDSDVPAVLFHTLPEASAGEITESENCVRAEPDTSLEEPSTPAEASIPGSPYALP